MAMSQKLVALFVLLGVLATFVTAEGKIKTMSIPKNVILGYREPKDYVIQNETIIKPRQFLSYTQFEKTFVGDNHSMITQVRIIDMNTDGNGAIANVITGGPGSTFITIFFKSLFNGGINYAVTIYGEEPAGNQ